MARTDDAADGQREHVRIETANNSAFNFGEHGSAQTTNVVQAPGQDPAQQELLAAVRALREDLGRFVRNEETEALDAELGATEEEITGSGAAGPGRLRKLRDSLAAAGSVVTALGSGVAVGQAVTALLGG